MRAIIADGAFSTDTTLEHLMKRWAYIFAKVRFVYENHPPQFWRFLRWLLFRECKRKLGCSFPSVRKVLKRMAPGKAILFIHGQRDSYIPVEQSQLLHDLAPGPKSLWIVPKAKHNQSVMVCPDYYAARTVSFFDQYLAGVDSASTTSPAEPTTTIRPASPSARPPAPVGTAGSFPGQIN